MERDRRDAAALERRLKRLGFDLHDGALQDVAALLADVRHFRSRFEGAVDDDDVVDLTAGLLEDLEARLIDLDAELRRLARSHTASSAVEVPLAEALGEQVREFAAESGIEARLQLDGNFDALTPTQTIAVFRVVQTALANVRRHSDARSVEVRVRRDDDGIEAEVVDDGSGFDVDEALLRAAGEGRLGLAGISERARLLGGDATVESGAGNGRTRVAVRLPDWRPDSA